MTSKPTIQIPSRVSKMPETAMKSLVGRKMTKEIKFMGESIRIKKLSVSQVLDIQIQAKNIEKDEAEGFNVLKTVIRASVEDAKELSDEDFNDFPLDELSKLSTAIMQYSGIGSDVGK